MKNKGLLECCVDSVESAVAAQRGGADRLELCGVLLVGGVTPSISLLERVKEVVQIPIHVLIRPRFGDFCYTDEEVELMCREIRWAKEKGAQGVVIGALTPEGELDQAAMKRMIQEAEGLQIVMHRAIDVCKDPIRTMEEAYALEVKTFLTSGQAENCSKGKEMLAKMQDYAAGRMEIMAGAGICAEVICELASIGIRSFHMSGKKVVDSRMCYRKEGVPMGLPSFGEFEIYQTDEEKIRAAKRCLQEICI